MSEIIDPEVSCNGPPAAGQFIETRATERIIYCRTGSLSPSPHLTWFSSGFLESAFPKSGTDMWLKSTL